MMDFTANAVVYGFAVVGFLSSVEALLYTSLHFVRLTRQPVERIAQHVRRDWRPELARWRRVWNRRA